MSRAERRADRRRSRVRPRPRAASGGASGTWRAAPAPGSRASRRQQRLAIILFAVLGLLALAVVATPLVSSPGR